MKRNHNDYFIYYLKDNVLIFDVFDYVEELASDTIDFLNDWNLLKDGKVSYKSKTIKEFLQRKISNDVKKFNLFIVNNNCQSFCYFKKKNNLNVWSEFFEDPEKFLKHCKRICKDFLINFYEDKCEDCCYFQKVKGKFLDIPCLSPSGEDEVFLQKIIKTLKKPLDFYVSEG